MQRVGYIGLGIMGAAMTHNLIKNGKQMGIEVYVWNRTRSKAEPLIAEGAIWKENPSELAASVDILCINVTNTPDVEEVLFGAEGVARRTNDDPLVAIDHSTISPSASRDFAKRLKESGIDFLDAPVTGGDVGARAGTLSIMVGGEAFVFEQCAPVLATMGRPLHVGESGSGQVCKACNQILGALNLLGVCEAMTLARKEGLEVEKMLEATQAGAGNSWALEHLGQQISREDFAPGFMIDLMSKDLNIVKEEAGEKKLSLTGTNMAAQLFQVAREIGLGKNGTQALIQVVEKLSSVHYDVTGGHK